MAVKSHNLCFFDQVDNFTKPAQFTTIIASSEYQTGIWYLENYNMWVTTDASLKWYNWDLVEEKVIESYSSKLLQGSIIEIVEITHLRLIGTASLDKQILLWREKSVLLQIPLGEFGGIHTFLYSYYFQVVLSCGYSTTIQVHQIEATFLDVTLVG